MKSTCPRPCAAILIEDDDSVRNLACRVLETAGGQVTAVATGTEAMKVLAQGHHIDVLIADLHLPDVPGSEVARQFRRNRPDVKVLYTTGFADDLFADAASLPVGEAFLEKPYSCRGLIEAVSLLLHGHIRPVISFNTDLLSLDRMR